ncbi:MFS transporter [Actinomadura scrupuli]|uniref:MFS transporter n=1 Tax=Actinomadura scrupuli TaxID=559629 RepID=UPI003D98E77A
MTATMREPTASHTKAGRLPLAAVCLGYFLVILDVTVVTVAIPVIGTDLHTGLTALQWVVDGYTLAFAGLLLFCGGLNDRLGGKPVFLSGLVVFTVASAGCGLAPSTGALIGARLVQGVGAALMVPASLALLRNAYSDRESRARAFGAWGMVAGIAAGAGPVLGGVLVFAAGWRWVFFVNIPFGVLGRGTRRAQLAGHHRGAVQRAAAHHRGRWSRPHPAAARGLAGRHPPRRSRPRSAVHHPVSPGGDLTAPVNRFAQGNRDH